MTFAVLGLLVGSSGESKADVIYNNFTGYSAFWNPLGNPNTATYGETFTAPSGNQSVLQSFSLYLAGPAAAGNINLHAYIATWTGSHAGTILYTSPLVNYPNTGNAQLSFSTGGLPLTPGGSYVAFLSVSQEYGSSSGLSFASVGDGSVPGGSFVYFNNGGNFGALTTQNWDATGLTPNFSFSALFTAAVPEPATLIAFGVMALGGAGYVRRRKVAATA